MHDRGAFGKRSKMLVRLSSALLKKKLGESSFVYDQESDQEVFEARFGVSVRL